MGAARPLTFDRPTCCTRRAQHRRRLPRPARLGGRHSDEAGDLRRLWSPIPFRRCRHRTSEFAQHHRHPVAPHGICGQRIPEMTRTDGDSWDVASSVGATATMVAAARPWQPKRSHLIDDPLAEPLVRAVGIDFSPSSSMARSTSTIFPTARRQNGDTGRRNGGPHQVL